MNSIRSFFLLMLVVSFLLTMNVSALAQNHVYTAGDKIRQWDLNGTPQLVWNFPGIDVAVDPPLTETLALSGASRREQGLREP